MKLLSMKYVFVIKVYQI